MTSDYQPPSGGGGGNTTATYVTEADEHVALPNSYQLIQGTNVTITPAAGTPNTLTISASGGTAAPGGTNGQVQYNAAGALGGFTTSGDGTINTSTGVLTVTKTNGTAFGTAATENTTAIITDNGSGGLTIGSAQVTGSMVASSIALAGSPTTTTQASTDNSTKISTTAFVTTAVNNAIAGINPAVAVQAATTAAANTSGLTYNNGASGIGATFTGSNNTAITFDGYTFTALGQRALVKNDTQSPSGAFNGIYYVTQVQTAILPPILTRVLDYDQPSDMNNTGAIPVVNGTVNGGTSWVLTSTVNTVGTDPLTYTQFSLNPTTIQTNTLANTDIWVGNGSNVAAAVAMSGDATLANTGALTIAANAVSNAKFRQSAAQSVVGNSTNSTANVADISASGANQILASNAAGTAIAFAAQTNAQLPVRSQIAVQTLTFNTTLATDASLGSKFRCTLTNNFTLSNPTNAVDGQMILWELIQDGSGGHTIAYDTNFAFGTDIATAVLTTTPSKRDFLGVIYDSGAGKFYVIAFVRGY